MLQHSRWLYAREPYKEPRQLRGHHHRRRADLTLQSQYIDDSCQIAIARDQLMGCLGS